MTSYWWVNHKQTFKHEIEGGYLWSPKFKSNGDRNYFYDTMADAAVGDVVFSYANGKIAYFGIVVEEASTSIKPAEFGAAGDDWDNEGWHRANPNLSRLAMGKWLQRALQWHVTQ